MYHDDEIVEKLSFDLRVSIQAAAYTTYVELNPKKALTPREFRNKFIDNWTAFATIENENTED